MGRLPKAAKQVISMGRVNPNTALTNTPGVLGSIGDVAGSVSSTMLQKRKQVQAIEEQRQDALNTIKVNRAGVDMSRDMRQLQDRIGEEYRDNPAEAQEAYRRGAEEIRSKYEGAFADDPRVMAKFSTLSRGVMNSNDSKFESWKSKTEVVNATSDYTESQAGLVEMAGNTQDLAGLQEQLINIEANGAIAGPWLMKDGKDVEANIRKYKKDAVKQFLYGQIQRSPETVEEYLKADIVEDALTEAEEKSLRDDARSARKKKESKIKTANYKAQMKTVYGLKYKMLDPEQPVPTVSEINSTIESFENSGANASIMQSLYSIKNSLLEESQKQARQSRAESVIEIERDYSTLFDPDADVIRPDTTIEEAMRLQAKIVEFEKNGKITSATAQGYLKDINRSTDAIIKGREEIEPRDDEYDPVQLPQLFEGEEETIGGFFGIGGEKVKVPADAYNRGKKNLTEWAEDSFSDKTMVEQARAKAVEFYILNYDKFAESETFTQERYEEFVKRKTEKMMGVR